MQTPGSFQSSVERHKRRVQRRAAKQAVQETLPSDAFTTPADALPSNALVGDIRSTVLSIWHNKIWIVFSTLFFTVAALAFALLITPVYEATSQIFVDPRSKALVDDEIVPTGLGRSSIGGDLLLLDSQIAIIGSEKVLRGALEKEIADGRKQAPAGGQPDFMMLDALRKSLEISRQGNSYIIGVSVRDPNPQSAARMANTVAQTYIALQSNSRSNATRETTNVLNQRVTDLRGKVLKAEQAIEQFRSENGLIGISGNGPNGNNARLINDEQLRSLNDRLASAKADLLAAEAAYETIRQSSARDLLAGATPDAISSQTIANLRNQLADITRRQADAETTLGPRHPRIASLNQERASLDRLIDAELSRIVQAAGSRKDAAKRNVSALQQSINQLAATSSSDNQAMVRLRELEREAAAQRAVLETLQLRAKQSGEQENLSNDSTRIISEAIPPIFPAFPNKKLVVAAGLFAGITIGTLLAWVIALFSNGEKPAQAPKRSSRSRSRKKKHSLLKVGRRADAPEEKVRTESVTTSKKASQRKQSAPVADKAEPPRKPKARRASTSKNEGLSTPREAVSKRAQKAKKEPPKKHFDLHNFLHDADIEEEVGQREELDTKAIFRSAYRNVRR